MAKLVSRTTGAELTVPFTHDDMVVIGFVVPHKVGSTGRVNVECDGMGHMQYFPSVVGACIVDYCPACEMDSDDFEPLTKSSSWGNTVCGACGHIVYDPRNDPKVTGETK
jgi:rubredoxin